MLKPYRVAAIFPLATAGVILSSLAFTHYSHRSFVTLLILAAIALLGSCIRFMIGNRPPAWSLHVDLLVGLVFVSVLCSIQSSAHVDFTVLFVWIAVFAALYLRSIFAVLHLGGVGVAFAIVLTVGPSVANPVTAWIATFGSAAVLSAVTIGLVNVLRSSSHEDMLTRLANRRAWDDRLDEELERARRNKTPLSLSMIDVDNFKAVNDRGGHSAGDLLLCELADRWRAVIREGGDFLARLGGDEFGVIASNMSELEIQRLAKRLQEITPVGVSCSVGVATWDGVESAAELFRRADEAMYQVKRGRQAA
ncbi:MAG: GGDEF domain-containing protein [Acidimicrobiales bacterium]